MKHIPKCACGTIHPDHETIAKRPVDGKIRAIQIGVPLSMKEKFPHLHFWIVTCPNPKCRTSLTEITANNKEEMEHYLKFIESRNYVKNNQDKIKRLAQNGLPPLDI
jgi:hypothetical protein